MTAGSDIENGFARSLTDTFSFSLRRASKARRVSGDTQEQTPWQTT